LPARSTTGAILVKAIHLRGVYVGSVADLAAALASGVRPVIDEAFAFDQADGAYARLRSGAISARSRSRSAGSGVVAPAMRRCHLPAAARPKGAKGYFATGSLTRAGI
jgi:hypothetical protein